jgi:response regulator RpfG family c-di-GMP phosphodiesterase
MSERIAPDGGPGATVVVVDDERDVADLYTSYLRDYYDVRTAYGGAEALEAIDDTVDVVLLDRRMPEMSGDDVLETIRDRGYDCRVVMVTAVEPDFDIVDMPLDEYLSKPVDRETILEEVERQLVLDTYDSRLEEYLQRRAKLDVLEEEKSQRELDESDRYQELKVVTESLREDLERMISEHDQIDADSVETDGFDPETLEGP